MLINYATVIETLSDKSSPNEVMLQYCRHQSDCLIVCFIAPSVWDSIQFTNASTGETITRSMHHWQNGPYEWFCVVAMDDFQPSLKFWIHSEYSKENWTFADKIFDCRRKKNRNNNCSSFIAVRSHIKMQMIIFKLSLTLKREISSSHHVPSNLWATDLCCRNVKPKPIYRVGKKHASKHVAFMEKKEVQLKYEISRAALELRK